METTMKILSLDPGTDNYGWAALTVERGAYRLIRCGMIDETIKELREPTELQSDASAYVRRFAWLLKKSGAEAVGAERYVPRRQGLSNESVNQMLGVTVGYSATVGIPCSLFLAATWKLRLKKVLDLELLYKQCKPVPDHVVDAVFIGLFTAEKQGHYKLEKLASKRQQALLCKAINHSFLDLRTGKRKKAARKPRKSRRS